MVRLSNNRALNHLANMSSTYLLPNVESKTVTFDGGTANGIGDEGGTNNPYTLATVTGEILVSVLAVCTTNLAGATATLEVGTSKSTAAIIAQTTATDIDADEIWHDASPDTNVEAYTTAAPVPKLFIVANGGDIITTVGTADITAGVIKFIFMWAPISEDGNLTVS